MKRQSIQIILGYNASDQTQATKAAIGRQQSTGRSATGAKAA
jgi:hypothetical protein